jgi:hypothetical protein
MTVKCHANTVFFHLETAFDSEKCRDEKKLYLQAPDSDHSSGKMVLSTRSLAVTFKRPLDP